jgi:hypothetical protein
MPSSSSQVIAESERELNGLDVESMRDQECRHLILRMKSVFGDSVRGNSAGSSLQAITSESESANNFDEMLIREDFN